MEKMYTEREANRMYAEYLKQQVVYHQSRTEMLQEELKGVVAKIEKLDSISSMVTTVNNKDENSLKIEEEEDSIAAVVRTFNENQRNAMPKVDEVLNTGADDVPLPFADTAQPRKNKSKGKKRAKYKTTRSGAERRDVKRVAKIMAHLLKEANTSVSLEGIKKELENRNIPTHSMYALMQQVRAYEPNIIKASWGYYRYKGE